VKRIRSIRGGKIERIAVERNINAAEWVIDNRIIRIAGKGNGWISDIVGSWIWIWSEVKKWRKIIRREPFIDIVMERQCRRAYGKSRRGVSESTIPSPGSDVSASKSSEAEGPSPGSGAGRRRGGDGSGEDDVICRSWEREVDEEALRRDEVADVVDEPCCDFMIRCS
jgi:hypothetical protein